MSLKPCTDCGKPVSTKAARCPNCGLKNPTVPADRAPLLFSAGSQVEPQARCRECGGALRADLKVCPFCGVQNPIKEGIPRWVVVTGVLVITLAAVGISSWQLVLNAVNSSLDTGLVRSKPRAASELPHIQSAAFAARCRTPAPVLVYVLGSVPERFRIRLRTREDREGDSLTNVFTKKYHLNAETTQYVPPLRAFYAYLKPVQVEGLRCEPSVEAIEEKTKPASRL